MVSSDTLSFPTSPYLSRASATYARSYLTFSVSVVGSVYPLAYSLNIRAASSPCKCDVGANPSASNTNLLSIFNFLPYSKIELYQALNCSSVSLNPLALFLAAKVSKSGILGSLANSTLYCGSNKCLVEATKVLP